MRCRLFPPLFDTISFSILEKKIDNNFKKYENSKGSQFSKSKKRVSRVEGLVDFWGSVTYRKVDIQKGGGYRSQGRIQDQNSKHDCMSRFVYRLVRLDEHRITFVHVFQVGRISEIQSPGSANGQGVRSRADIVDL